MTITKDLKLLLVEDNLGDFVLVSEYLKMVLPGSKLQHNKSLASALHSLNKDIFDIILLDLTLPDSNGVDSIREVVALSSNSPVIVLTGFSDKQFGIDSLKLGVEDYLIKDEVTPAILLKSIKYSIERKKNQFQLEQNEKRFRALIENSTDGMLVVDKAGNVLDISSMGRKILGIPANEVVVRISPQLLYPEDIDALVKCFREVSQNPGHISSFEMRLQLPDGESKWIENTFHNLLNEPAVAGIVANFKDITERKMTAENLRFSEEKYRYLFNKNPETIFIWDSESLRFHDFNETVLQLYGYSKEEMMQMTLLDLREEEEHENFILFANKMLSKEIDIYSALWKHKKKNGDIIYMNITSHSIIFNDKIAVLAIGSNVTEKVMLEKQLETERIKKHKEITEAVITAQEKERDEIGSELHDNVCQILASSKLYLGMVKKQLDNQEEMIDETDTLITSAIDELRTLSHSLIAPSLDQLELQQALGKIIDITSKTTQIKIHSNITHLDESLMTNKMRLAIYRIVQEQFNNILKYAKASNIYITMMHKNAELLLVISDDGIGFDPSVSSEGVGLLNIKTRASLFNGEVSIKSTIGKGTELSIVFS
jgi:PAS domain S-box-containing protein